MVFLLSFSNWLFGEKESLIKVTDGKDVRVRGWFPRPCAIPVSEKDTDLDNYIDMDEDIQYHSPNASVCTKSTETEISYNHRVQKVSSTASNKKKHK